MAALEDNLRKVYSVVAMEGGVHMNSIGPAIESQLDSIPLRCGGGGGTALSARPFFVFAVDISYIELLLQCAIVVMKW